jgi:HEAT repeat protein
MPLFGGSSIERLKTRGDTKALIKALCYRQDAATRRNAVIALGDLRAVEALDRLVLTLDDDHDALAQYAATALGKVGDVRALKPLLRVAAQSTCYSTKKAAAEALVALGAPALEALDQVAVDTRAAPAEREAAAKAGRRIRTLQS